MSEPREAVGGGRTGERRGEVRTGDRVRWTGVRGGSVSTLVIDQSATQAGVWTSCDNKNFRSGNSHEKKVKSAKCLTDNFSSVSLSPLFIRIMRLGL